MNTYEFMVTVAGSDFKAYTQSNNPLPEMPKVISDGK